MSGKNRVRKIGNTYFPAHPDGRIIPEFMDHGFLDGAEAYKTAMDIKEQIEQKGVGIIGKAELDKMYGLTTGEFVDELIETPYSPNGWHEYRGEQFRFKMKPKRNIECTE